MATFSFSNIQAGLLSSISTFSPFICDTLPNIGAVPIFNLRSSSFCIGRTLVSSVIPTAESKRFTESLSLLEFSGRVPGLPTTEPMNESLLVLAGSHFVPIATNPPGLTKSTKPAPVPNEVISVCRGSYVFFFSSIIPGLISISSPILKIP